MKRLLLVIIILLVLPLTGCMQKYTATDQQSDEIAEYMAGLLLKNDEYYNEKLVTTDETAGDNNTSSDITRTPTPTNAPNPGVTQVPNNGTGNEGTTKPSTAKSITDVIGDNNFDITYKSYKVTNTYPDNSDNALFVLTHSNGYKLLVVSFSIKNTTNADQTFNLNDDNMSYQLSVNPTTEYSPLLTLLENDLQYIDVKIGAGEIKKGILIFEVSEKSDLSNMNLIVTKGDKTVTIGIK